MATLTQRQFEELFPDPAVRERILAGKFHPKGAAKAVARRPPGGMNKTEKAFSVLLDAMKSRGEIIEWAFQPETFMLGFDCRYTPDFRAIDRDGIVEFYEVKAGLRNGRPLVRDDALVKWKVAAVLHPYVFIMTWRVKDKWQYQCSHGSTHACAEDRYLRCN